MRSLAVTALALCGAVAACAGESTTSGGATTGGGADVNGSLDSENTGGPGTDVEEDGDALGSEDGVLADATASDAGTAPDALPGADTGAADDGEVPNDTMPPADTATPDAGLADSGSIDDIALPEDAAGEDGGPADTLPPDTAGPIDAGPADTGPADTGPTDTGPDDTGPDDTGPVDPAGPADTGSPADTAVPDAGPGDVGVIPDAGSATPALDALLAALRADTPGALQAQSEADGWPAAVEGGVLIVSTLPGLTLAAGDHDGWVGTAMTADQGFHWVVLPLPAGSRYKLTDGQTFTADPWSRAYVWDEFGAMSLTAPATAHLERFFAVTDGVMPARTVRVLVPAGAVTHLLYAHDGQNLFDPNAIWGGWKLGDSAPDGMMIVGIDNTPARISEYTHVTDDIGDGPIGGNADAYLAYVKSTVRPLIAAHYGEAPKVGLMGSSLGGLVSLYGGLTQSEDWDFVASLSGTVGWGSIGDAVHNATVIELFAAGVHLPFAIYIDSGGGGTCVDSDADGIQDDAPDGADNYCENKQLEATLVGLGYQYGVDLTHWWEPGAPHNEAAWAARVFRALQMFEQM